MRKFLLLTGCLALSMTSALIFGYNGYLFRRKITLELGRAKNRWMPELELRGDTVRGKEKITFHCYNSFSNGWILDGELTTYHLNNNVNIVCNYKEGVLSGNYTEYYKTGIKSVTGKMKQGEMDGIWKDYSPSGSLVCISSHVRGKTHGISKGYHENGFVSAMIEYKMGKKNGKQIFWYEDGTMELSCSYIEGLKHGVCQYWHENGFPYVKEVYSHDKINGERKMWDKRGLIQARELWENGCLCEWLYWNAKGEKIRFSEFYARLGDFEKLKYKRFINRIGINADNP